MSETELLVPFLEGGVENSHYFNGRILTADALRADQTASRRQRQQLGQAIGAGVVRGLSVRLVTGSDPPALRVTAGLALNGQGQTLQLAQDVDVTLAHEADTEAAAGGLFVACQPTDTGEYVTGRNVYVLALAPASGYREKAPMYDLSPGANGAAEGKADGCGFRYAVEGVQFRLVEIDLEDEDVISDAAKTAVEELILAQPQTAAARSRLRNLLAHLCLGTMDAVDFPADLFSYLAGGAAPPAYGLLAHLTDPDPAQADEYTLTPCDVPLALLYWTTDGVQFVDMWAVRRRLIRPDARLSGLPLVSDRRLAEGEAAFWQFQAQVAEMTRPDVTRAELVQIEAREHFHYLPAAGVIPFTSGVSNRGFDYLKFFDGLTIRDPVFIEGAKVPPLLRLSYTYPVIDLAEKEMIWLYLVRENRESDPAPQPYLIFTSGYIPYQDDAQYDLSRWQYSNYGPGLVAFRSRGEGD